jgi:hypothetical protein
VRIGDVVEHHDHPWIACRTDELLQGNECHRRGSNRAAIVGDTTGNPIETGSRHEIETDIPATCLLNDPPRPRVAAIPLQEKSVHRLTTLEKAENGMKTKGPQILTHGSMPH